MRSGGLEEVEEVEEVEEMGELSTLVGISAVTEVAGDFLGCSVVASGVKAPDLEELFGAALRGSGQGETVASRE